MKILLINHYAGGGGLGMEHRPFIMAQEWTKLGHEVLIVASGYAHTRTHQPNIQGRKTKIEIEGINYLFLKTPSYSGNSWKRVRNMGVFVARLYQNSNYLAKTFNPDIVIASSTYPLDIYPASVIASKSNAKLIYEVHDLWPLSPMELGGYSSRHPYIKMLQKGENYAYRKCDRVVSLLPCTLPHMIEHGMDPANFKYIPNGIRSEDWDVNGILPAEHMRIIEDLKADGKKIVGYTGAMGVANALDPFVEAAHLVKDLPVAFLLVGSGPEKQNLMNKGQQMGATNIYFASNVSKQLLPSLLNHMDFLFVGFRKQPLYRFGVSPNKIFDYMMAGKPIIQAIEACNNPVQEAGCGIAIEPDNPVAIAEAIQKLITTKNDKLNKLGEAGREWVKQHHEYRVLSQNFLEGL